MAAKRMGVTVAPQGSVRLYSWATAVGPKEGTGPLKDYFPLVVSDPMHGQATPEKAEKEFLLDAVQEALKVGDLKIDQIDYLIGGDLLNQIVSCGFAARQLSIPFLGIYGACSSFVEGVTLATMAIDGGFADRVMVMTSSHYQTAERQFRYPIELNIQRPATAQWTATGAGAAVLATEGSGPAVSFLTVGRVVDMGLKDPTDMGSAMAPAAADTLLRHFSDTNRTAGDYDLILTGDLGKVGSKLFRELVRQEGITLGDKHQDAGCLIYSPNQNAGAGGSGCACSAVVTLGYVLSEFHRGKLQSVLILATGALHSPLTFKQGESVPGICHAVALAV